MLLPEILELRNSIFSFLVVQGIQDTRFTAVVAAFLCVRIALSYIGLIRTVLNQLEGLIGLGVAGHMTHRAFVHLRRHDGPEPRH